MTEEWNLSDYEKEDGYYPNMAVKEFIKKERLTIISFILGQINEDKLGEELNKLAGSKLVGAGA